MYVILLHYVQSIDVVDAHLAAHQNFLDEQIDLGNFIACGPQAPRIGGVILARSMLRRTLDAILLRDPLYREHLAQYEVIEFKPQRTAEGVGPMLMK